LENGARQAKDADIWDEKLLETWRMFKVI
jgi:hypothetical protein